VLVKSVPGVWSGGVCRGRKNVLFPTNHNYIGSVSSTCLSYFKQSSACDGRLSPTCTLGMVRVDGPSTKRCDCTCSTVSSQGRGAWLQPKNGQTFDETALVQSICVNVHLWGVRS